MRTFYWKILEELQSFNHVLKHNVRLLHFFPKAIGLEHRRITNVIKVILYLNHRQTAV